MSQRKKSNVEKNRISRINRGNSRNLTAKERRELGLGRNARPSSKPKKKKK